MKRYTITISLICLLNLPTTVSAQFPTATEEHKVLKQEEGEWDATVTMLMGPAGPYDPPHTAEAKESNRMIGDFWLISDFTGSFEGMPFTGLGQVGYDTQAKSYVGTWVDSFSPHATEMVGEYDAESRTMTYKTTGVGMDGKPSKGKNVVVYGDDERTMTMYMAAPGTDEMIKVMEIVYKRSK